MSGKGQNVAIRILSPQMITLAVWLWGTTVAIGAVMAVRFLGERQLASRPVAAVHGVLGAAGLAALLVALATAGATSNRYGTAAFGPAAAVLATIAVIIGLTIAVRGRSRPRGPGLLIGIHATIAVTAAVLLLAYAVLV